jgi:hypothetical protein
MATKKQRLAAEMILADVESGRTVVSGDHIAAELMSDLTALTAGKLPLGEFVESLKSDSESLSLLEEEEHLPSESDIGPAVDDDSEITFTTTDQKDLTKLEKKVTGGTRQAAEGIREIRNRKLWRMEKDKDGCQRYSSFETYCKERHGHSRVWVTYLTNWLAITEEAEHLGLDVQLSVYACRGLGGSKLEQAGGLRAVLEEAVEDGTLYRDSLHAIVERRAEFTRYQGPLMRESIYKPAATTYAEYKKDLAVVKEVDEYKTSPSTFHRAKTEEGDFADNLVKQSQKDGTIPRSDELLVALTGEALASVVARLVVVGKEQAAAVVKKNELVTIRAARRAMSSTDAMKKLRADEKALEAELGIVKKKKDKDKAPSDAGAAPTEAVAGATPTETGAIVPAVTLVEDNFLEDNDNEDDNDEDDLTLALGNLDDALTYEWPDDLGELNAILVKIQDCEIKLGAIKAKVLDRIASAK